MEYIIQYKGITGNWLLVHAIKRSDYESSQLAFNRAIELYENYLKNDFYSLGEIRIVQRYEEIVYPLENIKWIKN